MHFIANRTPPGTFRFAGRTSAEGQAALARFPAAARADAIVFIDGDQAAVKSAAVIAIARRLDRPWRAASWARCLPVPLRDAVYDVVARNRYRWFGRR